MRLLKSIVREPFVHFMILGFILYIGFSRLDDPSEKEKIIVGDDEIKRIKTIYQQQFGVEPSGTQLNNLLENHIREEIYWREGVALGLDDGDRIVRRRVAQKFAFLQLDLASPEQPDDKQIRDYFHTHPEKYREPDRVSFSHVYVAMNSESVRQRQQRLREVAQMLSPRAAEHPASIGDPFPGQWRIVLLSEQELTKIFGDSPLVKAVTSAPLKKWSGPFQSGYGTHFVHLTDKIPGTLPPLETIRGKVAADYLEDKRRQLNAAAYARLLDKYEITVGQNP